MNRDIRCNAGFAALLAALVVAGLAAAHGERPLLTILLESLDLRFSSDHDRRFDERLKFGTESGEALTSLAGVGRVSHENSHGNFVFTNAGVVGPVVGPDNPRSLNDESLNEPYRRGFASLLVSRKTGLRSFVLLAAS